MQPVLLVRLAVPVLALVLSQTAGAAGDAARGERRYTAECSNCHALDETLVGPAHRGVYGRRIASVPGYDYSDALKKKSDGTWTDATLDRWLAGPERYAPGQSMGVSVPDAQARADLIAYLRTLRAR